MVEHLIGWSARTLAQRVGVPASTVASWVSTGLITPEQFGRGRNGHTIGVTGLLELLTIIELRQTGFSTQAIRRAVMALRKLSGQDHPLAQLTLVICGKDIAWKNADDLASITISALHKPGQCLMVFPVGEKHTEFLRRLREDVPYIKPVKYNDSMENDIKEEVGI